MQRLRRWLSVVSFSLLTVACGGATYVPPTATVTATSATLPATATPASTATSLPTPTATPLSVPVLSPTIELDYQFLGTGLELHQAILFESQAAFPFAGIKTAGSYVAKGDTVLTFYKPQLWMISLDGQTSGRLSFEDIGTAIYLPPNPMEKPRVILHLGRGINEVLFPPRLPGECFGELTADEERFVGEDDINYCNNFQFSPDGRSLAFNFGPPQCGRGIIVLEVQTGEKIYRSQLGTGHGFEFLSNGQVLLSVGHCEGGTVSALEPATRVLTPLGQEGSEQQWNPPAQAFVVQTNAYVGFQSSLWGYDLLRGSGFVGTPRLDISNSPLWSPDGQTLFYRYRNIQYLPDPLGVGDKTFRASQIQMAEVATGLTRTVLADPAYDYSLCGENGCWFGDDWLQVTRRPYRFAERVFGGEPAYDAVETCIIYAQNCPDPPTYFALNWRTGELLPWAEANLPTPTALPPTPAPTLTPAPKPNLAAAPLYADPAGHYGFYVGQDGHSLWLVPTEGEPQLWVVDGAKFIYLP